MVFYGDHLPGIYGSETIDQNPGLGMYTTPFFIWSSEGTPKRTLPQSSPTQFLPMLYETADAPIPPYFALLDRLRKRVTALEQGRMLDPTGQEITEEDLDPAGQQRAGRRPPGPVRLLHRRALVGRPDVARLGALSPATPGRARVLRVPCATVGSRRHVVAALP